MVRQLARASSLFWVQAEHGVQEGGDRVRGFGGEFVFVVQDVLEGPEAEFVDVAEFA